VARVLIVGCGCRGRELAAALVAEGHAVRGTTRHEDSISEIEAAGAQAVVADPDRLATLLPLIEGVSVICWLMGTAAAPALHGPRLRSIVEKLVDTPVRGFVYEEAGSVERDRLEEGAAIVREAGEVYRMPVELLEQDPADRAAWLGEATAAVRRVLG
jgi:putative NAD(P)-binding protein